MNGLSALHIRGMAKKFVRGSIIEDAAAQLVAQIMTEVADAHIAPRDAEITSLRSQLEEARARITEWEAHADATDAARSRFHALEWDKKSPAALEARAKAIEECARVAEGWPVQATGDDYQTSGNGRFWDAGSVYDQARIDTAFELRALLTAPTEERGGG